VLTQSIPPGSIGLFAIKVDDLGAGDYRFSAWAIAEFYHFTLQHLDWNSRLNMSLQMSLWSLTVELIHFLRS
jgi:hypothetical protein